MSGYEQLFRRLDEVGTISRGKSKHRPRNDPILYGGPHPFIQTGDVKHANFYVNSYSQTYSDKGLAQSKLWPEGTLCITIAANIADTAVLKFPACFPDSIIGFTAKDRVACTAYVKYCLDTYKTQMQSISQGTTQDNMSQGKLLSLKFRIPDFQTQQKIAAILSAYDDLIANNQRRIALLERMAEDIYREWFVRLRFPRHELVKIEKGIPQGWSLSPSTEAFDVLGGGTPNTDVPVHWNGHIPFFTPKDATENFYALTTEKNITDKGLSACSTQLFPKNTVFITARGTVGKLALAGRAMAMNQSCYALKPKHSGAVYFHYLAIRESIAYIKGVSKSGVFDNIVMDTFKNVPLLMPPSALLERFNQLVKPLFVQIANLLEQNQRLTEARDALLPRLISGQLTVDGLDIHFPLRMQAELDKNPAI